MKKILFVLLLAIACTGCESKVSDNPENAMYGWEYVDNYVKYRVLQIYGHEYIIFKSDMNGSIAVVHSESCPCKNKKKR